jgi:hypothetical protein
MAKGAFFNGLNLMGYSRKIVDQRDDVEEDKEDVQNQSRVGIIFVTKAFNELEGLDGEGKAQEEDHRDNSDKRQPKLEREDILLKAKEKSGGHSCGHKGQQEAGDCTRICFSRARKCLHNFPFSKPCFLPGTRSVKGAPRAAPSGFFLSWDWTF